jgi:hypothetical protein
VLDVVVRTGLVVRGSGATGFKGAAGRCELRAAPIDAYQVIRKVDVAA